MDQYGIMQKLETFKYKISNNAFTLVAFLWNIFFMQRMPTKRPKPYMSVSEPRQNVVSGSIWNILIFTLQVEFSKKKNSVGNETGRELSKYACLSL